MDKEEWESVETTSPSQVSSSSQETTSLLVTPRGTPVHPYPVVHEVPSDGVEIEIMDEPGARAVHHPPQKEAVPDTVKGVRGLPQRPTETVAWKKWKKRKRRCENDSAGQPQAAL